MIAPSDGWYLRVRQSPGGVAGSSFRPKITMEIRDTKPVSRAAPLRKAAPAEAASAATPAAIEEAVSLAGVPESEMTPRVRQALMGLLGEVDRLRRELDDSRNRIAFLER